MENGEWSRPTGLELESELLIVSTVSSSSITP